MRTLSIGVIGLVAALGVACSGADNFPKSWVLDANTSGLSYVTTKNETISETNVFGTLSGSVSADGAAIVRVPLVSVDTKIPVRNDRVKSILFEVETYPDLVVTAQIDPDDISAIAVGNKPVQRALSINISLHGIEAARDIDVEITRPKFDSIHVITTKPILIQASDFDLQDGIDQLRDLAKLDSISYTVPVSFDLNFTGQ